VLQSIKSSEAILNFKAIQSDQEIGLKLTKFIETMPDFKAIQPLIANLIDSILDSDRLILYNLEQRKKKNELKSNETDHQLEQNPNNNKDDKSESELHS